LIALCFLLPFATVSCDQAKTTFTGIQLVTHTVPRGGILREEANCSSDISVCVERDAATTTAIAFAAALVGAVLGALSTRRGFGWCASTGLGAMLVLAGKAVASLADVTVRVGYVLAAVLFLFAWVSALRGWRRGRRAQARDVGPPDVIGQPDDFAGE
jgi:hypothetical protein